MCMANTIKTPFVNDVKYRYETFSMYKEHIFEDVCLHDEHGRVDVYV